MSITPQYCNNNSREFGRRYIALFDVLFSDDSHVSVRRGVNGNKKCITRFNEDTRRASSGDVLCTVPYFTLRCGINRYDVAIINVLFY